MNLLESSLSNDYIDAEAEINKSINEIAKSIDKLANKGAKYIVISNAPDIGLIPAFVNTPSQSTATNLTNQFNEKIDKVIENFNKKTSLYGSSIQKFDLAQQTREIIGEYHKKGYEVTRAAASDIKDYFDDSSKLMRLASEGGKIKVTLHSERPIDEHVFFDSFHPTGSVHKKLGEHIFNKLISKFETDELDDVTASLADTTLK